MNADRHALNAALEYAAKQEQDISRLEAELRCVARENNELHKMLEKVSRAVNTNKTRPINECNAAQPMGMDRPEREDF